MITRHLPLLVASTLLAGLGLSTTSAAASDLTPIYSVDTRDKVAFITIDDGIVKDKAARRFITENEIPVTAFLTTGTTTGHDSFFASVTEFGSVQNHTVSHASFSKSATNLNKQICKAQKILTKRFGQRPWMLRPPYGAGAHRSEVAKVAKSCGIEHIVMWDAVVNNGKISYARGKLRPGSIILLHFRDDLTADLKAALRAIRKAGLRPAPLGEYLNPKNTQSW